MNARIRIATVAASTLAASLLSPDLAWAQGAPTGNPGQFGGSAPGQFDPNAQPGATPGTTAPAPSPFGGMNAGGLTPPPPAGPTMMPPPNPNDPTQVLEDSKAEDSGRGLTWFWAEVGGGIEHIGLQTIDDDIAEGGGCEVQTSTGCVQADRDPSATASRTGTGPMIEGGLGVRLVFVTFGARGRIGFFDTFDLATVGGELGFRIPIGSIEPRMSAGAGYAATMNGNSATGYYARVGGGLDYFLSTNFAIGGDVNGELVGLTVPALDLSAPRQNASGQSVSDDSDLLSSAGGIGLGVALGLHVGLHL